MYQRLKRPLHIFRLLALSAAILAASCVSRQGAPGSAKLDGEAIIKARCLVCHETDLIQQQRLSKAGWTKEVEKMIRWGALVSDPEKEALVAFLAGSFGPRPLSHGPQASPTPMPASASIEAGKKVFETRCLVCHEPDLVSQQRLTRAGWTKEVEKMTRWGAVVADTEKDALIDYLSVNHPQRKQ